MRVRKSLSYYLSVDYKTKIQARLRPQKWTTLTLHGDGLQSFFTGPDECDFCHWLIPYAEGKFYHFCPGCGRKIRHDVVKQCDPSGKCPHGHAEWGQYYWPKTNGT